MAKEKNNLDTQALESKLVDLKKDGMNMRFRHTAGQLPQTHLMRANRREIARVKTALNKKGE
ncbi:MAG: 50S ribosomal protein L29 [Rickettsiales bacterium]|jgi:large subunit ribosomal protein L29|nr:50S ribosomal protein L29 [Rickettsiales bacterium]